MKKQFKIPFKKPGLRFWLVALLFLSLLLWNLYIYPNVDPYALNITGTWIYVIIINYLMLFYFLLPFIWFIKIRLRAKVVFTFIFIAGLIFWFFIGKKWFEGLKDSDEIKVALKLISICFRQYFLYIFVFHLTIVFAIVFNYKVLIARFLNKIHFRLYLLSSLALCTVMSFANYALFDLVIDKLFPQLYYLSYYKISELFLIHAAYLTFTTFVVLVWQYRQLLVAKQEAAQNELSALKAQINPHFLFNNLNTIYRMALQQDNRTPDVILQLSDFLRYVLYDTASDYIELAKEAEILETYISLQKARIDPGITTVEFIKEGDFKNLIIAPLLLLPLAENCFKYGKGRKRGKIAIALRFDGKKLLFETENTIALREKPNGIKSSGLGIGNVVKRLNLIYPEKHSFSYSETEGVFSLKMELEPEKIAT